MVCGLRWPDALEVMFSLQENGGYAMIQKSLQRHHSTVKKWRGVIESSCVFFNAYEMLQSFNRIEHLQADETFHGIRKYHRGKRTREGGTVTISGLVETAAPNPEKTDVVLPENGMPERFDRRIMKRGYLIRTETKGAVDVLPMIRMLAAPNATIATDGAAAYKRLADEGYKWDFVNHKVEFVNEVGVHTNSIEAYWSLVKRKIRKLGIRVGGSAGEVAAVYQFGSAAVNADLEETKLGVYLLRVILFCETMRADPLYAHLVRFATQWCGLVQVEMPKEDLPGTYESIMEVIWNQARQERAATAVKRAEWRGELDKAIVGSRRSAERSAAEKEKGKKE